MQAAATHPNDLITVPRTDPLRGTGVFLWTLRACVYGLLLLGAMLGGPAVRMAAIAAALLTPFADRGGAVRHALHVLGLVIGVALIPAWGIPLGGLLSGGLGNVVGMIVGALIVLCGCLLLFVALGRLLSRALVGHRYLYVINRAGGTLLGVAEGALVVLVLCWLLSMFAPMAHVWQSRLAGTHPRIAALLGSADELTRAVIVDDRAGRWAAQVNPLRDVPAFATAAAIGELTACREEFWAAYDAGYFDDLLAEPVVRRHFEAFANDAKMRHAVKIRDLTTLLGSRQFADAFEDDEFCQLVADHWPRIRARVSDADLARARGLTDRMGGVVRARVLEVEQRAQEFGIDLPRADTR